MFSRLLRPGKRSLESLSEQEILALAISSEEDDGRIYLAYADALRDAYPNSARVFEEMAQEERSRVTWEIEPRDGGVCLLTVTHDQLPPSANAELFGGWPMILSGLKTLLETGELLDTPGSLRYAG